MSQAGLGKMGSGRVVQGLVLQGDCFQPKLRRNRGKKLGVGGTPRGPSLHPHCNSTAPPSPLRSECIRLMRFSLWCRLCFFRCRFVPWWGFCPTGRTRHGLGVDSGCFCIHSPVIGVSGNNETAHASEKGPWIPGSISGHADSAFLVGRTNATSQGRGQCCSCLGPQGQECGPADRGLGTSDPGHCCSDTVCLVHVPAGSLHQGEPQRLCSPMLRGDGATHRSLSFHLFLTFPGGRGAPRNSFPLPSPLTLNFARRW